MTYPVRRSDRALALGITIDEADELEHGQPWLDHWAAWFGAGPANIRTCLRCLTCLAGRPWAGELEVIVGDDLADVPIAEMVRSVYAVLPEMVRFELSTRAIVQCGSAAVDPPPGAAGWFGDAPAGSTKPYVIALLTADASAFVHEVGHLHHAPRWHAPPLRVGAPKAITIAELAASASTEVLQAAEDDYMQTERAADAFATVLGWPVDSTSGLHGVRRREWWRRQVTKRAAVCAAAIANDTGETKCFFSE